MGTHENKFEAAEKALEALSLALYDTTELTDVAYAFSRTADLAAVMGQLLHNCRKHLEEMATPPDNRSDESLLRARHAENMLGAAETLLNDAGTDLEHYLNLKRAFGAAGQSSPQA